MKLTVFFVLFAVFVVFLAWAMFIWDGSSKATRRMEAEDRLAKDML